MSYDAVIFDMDGVIVDSEKQWKVALDPYLKKCVQGWSPEHSGRLTGLNVKDVYRLLVDEYSLGTPEDIFMRDCDNLANEVYQVRVVVNPQLQPLLMHMESAAIFPALASSSPKAWVDMVLDRFWLRERFRAIVSADDAGGKTKPLPDIHLATAKLLQLEPAQCLAIEDSQIGVEAAKAAGMFTVAYQTEGNEDQDLTEADLTVTQLNAIIGQCI